MKLFLICITLLVCATIASTIASFTTEPVILSSGTVTGRSKPIDNILDSSGESDRNNILSSSNNSSDKPRDINGDSIHPNINIHVNSSSNPHSSSPSAKILEQSETVALLNGAKDKLRVGLLEESISPLIELLEHDTNHFEANRLLGSVLLSLQRYKMAESLLYTAVKVSNWNDPNSIGNLAECLRLSNDLELSLKVASRGLNIELKNENERGEHGFLRFVLGSIYFNQGKYSLSSEWYLSSALIQVNYIEAWIRASTLRFPFEHINKTTAIDVLTVAVRQNPKNVLLLHKLGEALLINDLASDAAIILRQALDLDPKGEIADARSYLANAYITLGRTKEAHDLYQSNSPMFEFDILGFQSLYHMDLMRDGSV